MSAPSLDFAYVHVTRPRAPGLVMLQVGVDGYACRTADGVKIIVSGSVEADGRRWLHISASRPNRLPSWDDLARVKEIIIGLSRYAYQVFPPAALHVNINPYVLHLWACWDTPDGAVLPEFSGTLPDGRRSI